MIDKKKIEEAAQECADLYEQDLDIETYEGDTENDGQIHFCREHGADLFKDGAMWAQEEFLKDLWHDANEKPRQYSTILLKVKSKSTNFYYYVWEEWYEDVYTPWLPAAFRNSVICWAYINDILPKQKGDEK